MESSSLGNFENIPKEITFMIFDYIGINELKKMASTAAIMADLVCEYMKTQPGLDKLYDMWKSEICLFRPDCVRKHKAVKVGRVLKELVAFLRIDHKVNFIWEIFYLLKSRCAWNQECCQPNLFFGILVQVLMGDWTIEKISIGHDILEATNGQLKFLNDILELPVGSQQENEIAARSYYRSVYWTFVPAHRKTEWIHLILDKQPYYLQAKVLLLLFSPTDFDGNILWHAFTEDMEKETISYQICVDMALKELADVLHLLFYHTAIILHKILISIYEITGIPYSCPRRNNQLLMCTGDDILRYVIKNYLIASKFSEFVCFVNYCVMFPTSQMQFDPLLELVAFCMDCMAFGDRTSLLERFFKHYDQRKEFLSEKPGIRSLMRVLRRFPLRRSRRLPFWRLHGPSIRMNMLTLRIPDCGKES